MVWLSRSQRQWSDWPVVFADERKKFCPTQVWVRHAIDGGGEDVGSVSGWISVGSERGQRGESPFGTLLCGGGMFEVDPGGKRGSAFQNFF